MNRDYNTGTADNVVFFTGVEVERTPAHGMKTLFVTGVQDVAEIESLAVEEAVEHIFFGANHSFDPAGSEWDRWEIMITHFLHKGVLCSLDIPVKHAEDFLESCLIEHDNFIPQLRVPLPYIKQWNYNTMIKLDDKDFRASNPGVWCHSLHDLMSRETFTDWSQYGNDKVLNDNY